MQHRIITVLKLKGDKNGVADLINSITDFCGYADPCDVFEEISTNQNYIYLKSNIFTDEEDDDDFVLREFIVGKRISNKKNHIIDNLMDTYCRMSFLNYIDGYEYIYLSKGKRDISWLVSSHFNSFGIGNSMLSVDEPSVMVTDADKFKKFTFSTTDRANSISKDLCDLIKTKYKISDDKLAEKIKDAILSSITSSKK